MNLKTICQHVGLAISIKAHSTLTNLENIEKKLVNKLHNDFNYKMLLKYSLIKEDFKPIKFYFEEENNIKCRKVRGKCGMI